MPLESPKTPRALWWGASLFAGFVFLVSWWQWWTFQYGTFDLAFYVQSLWLALRGQWNVSLLNVPLMGNHAEPIVFLITPLFAICPHPMVFVAVQTLAFASMPFTAWRIARRLDIAPPAAICLALATILTPAALSIGIYEFHPEALAAPLLLLLIEARLAEKYGRFWLWFLAVLSVKENMALLLVTFCFVWAVLDSKRGRAWVLRWNVAPFAVAVIWLLICGKIISPALNAGNVDYLQLYGHLGKSGGDIILKFFTEPHRVFGALGHALYKGNLLPALLLPLSLPICMAFGLSRVGSFFSKRNVTRDARVPWGGLAMLLLAGYVIARLFFPFLVEKPTSWIMFWQVFPTLLLALLIPLLRPRWLIIAGPLLAQHLLSWRYTEWSLGAHYPAPFIPLFWIGAAEMISRMRAQKAVAAGLLACCVAAHFYWGPARNLAQEVPRIGYLLEEREWKAQMLREIPPDASVTASVPYLSHLATREHLISLHHIIKGLKTLSTAAYVPPPAGDVVIIDYGDNFTFSTVAGYYHPRMRTQGNEYVESSERLLHEYLRSHQWHAHSRNELTVLVRGEPMPPPPPGTQSLTFDQTTALTSVELVRDLPGVMQFHFGWQFTGERKLFPWAMLVFSDGKQLYPFIKGAGAIEAGEGNIGEAWTFVLPTWMPPHYYEAFLLFYDGNAAAYQKKMPPSDAIFVFRQIPLGGRERRPGETAP